MPVTTVTMNKKAENVSGTKVLSFGDYDDDDDDEEEEEEDTTPDISKNDQLSEFFKEISKLEKENQ